MAGKRLTPMDAMFLYGETADTMMHVGGLLPFSLPPDAPEDFLRSLMDEIRTTTVVQPPFTYKLKTPGFLLNPVHSWIEDPDFDIEYHVRRSALPHPGDERELGILVSRLHSNALDLTRPPWEMHLIEGLEGDRFAFYMKFHHSLVDGYSAMQLLIRSLSPDPDSRAEDFFFALPPVKRERTEEKSRSLLADAGTILGRALTVTKSVPELATSLVKLQVRRDGDFRDLISSYEAPHSSLNARIGRTRRFATQQYSLARLGRVTKASGATLNDVVLTICGGGLRRFLDEAGELGDKPLIAFLPVNVRPKGDVGGGNAVGAVLATMGTDIEDPVERLEAVSRSTRQAKRRLVNLPMESVLAYSAMLMAPSATQVLAALTGVPAPIPFTFNLCVSNVPGPRHPLYFRGARLEANYPLSIPIHGMALNITCQSYADTLNFGFLGDRQALPHLQRLAVYTGEELERLEAALGLVGPEPAQSAPAESPPSESAPSQPEAAADPAPARTAPARRVPAKRAAAKKTTTEVSAGAAEGTAKKATATKTVGKKATGTRAGAKKATATRASAKKTTAVTTADTTTAGKKATGTRAGAKKATTKAPATKATTTKAPVKKAAGETS